MLVFRCVLASCTASGESETWPAQNCLMHVSCSQPGAPVEEAELHAPLKSVSSKVDGCLEACCVQCTT